MSVQVKICGITTEAALDAAIDGGADYVGFVFFPKSPRNVDIATAKRLANRVGDKVKVVALTVDASDDLVTDINDAIGPDFFQLHGTESVDRIEAVTCMTGRPAIKAVAISTEDDVHRAETFLPVAELILFDAKPPTRTDALPGGNGIAFDWSLIANVADSVPYMLSGGLTPDNVAAAIQQTGAKIVDVSSGVESAPGVKDPVLIRRFLEAAKTAKQT